MSARVLKELLKVKLYTRKNVGKYSTVTKNLEVKSKLSDVEIPRVPLAELVFQDVQKWGNKIALVRELFKIFLPSKIPIKM